MSRWPRIVLPPLLILVALFVLWGVTRPGRPAATGEDTCARGVSHDAGRGPSARHSDSQPCAPAGNTAAPGAPGSAPGTDAGKSAHQRPPLSEKSDLPPPRPGPDDVADMGKPDTADSAGLLTALWRQEPDKANPGEASEFILEGVTVERGGEPVPGCAIEVRIFSWLSSDGSSVGEYRPTAGYSDKNGVFRIKLMLWKKSAEHSIYFALRAAKPGLCATDYYGVDIAQFGAGNKVGGIKLLLLGGATVEGAVVDDAGVSVPDARVYIHQPAHVNRRREGWPENITPMPDTFSARTDPSGVFVIKDVPAGTYSVTAQARGFESTVVTGVVVREGERRLGARPLVLKRATMVKCRLMTREGNTPSVNCRITFVDDGGKVADVIHAQWEDGYLYCATNSRVPPGVYTLQLEFIGRRENYKTVHIPAANVAAGQITDLGTHYLEMEQ